MREQALEVATESSTTVQEEFISINYPGRTEFLQNCFVDEIK